MSHKRPAVAYQVVGTPPQTLGWRQAWFLELKCVASLGWPQCITQFTQFLPGFLMLMFLEDADEIAGAGLGFMFGNVAGVSLIIGFSTGLAPLTSQAFGAGNHDRVGELLQRQMLLHLFLVCLPVAVIWQFSEPLLLAMGQPTVLSALSAKFLRWRLPALPFLAAQQDILITMQSLRITREPMLLSVLGAAFNTLLFAVLVPALGFVGAPLALSTTNIISGVALLALAPRWSPQGGGVPPFLSWRWRTAVSGWRELLQLSAPGALMIWAEWWGWELNLFFAGWLCTRDEDGPTTGNNTSWAQQPVGVRSSNVTAEVPSCTPLDVFPILSSTMVICFFVHVGFSIAAGAHVGNLQGAGEPCRARTAANVTLTLVFAVAAIEGLLLVVVRRHWGRMFTRNPEIVDSVASVLPLVAVYVILDALGPGCLNAILRGLGVVRVPAAINVVAFYLFGIPVGLALTFAGPGWGVFGLWTGLLLGMFLMVGGLLLYLCKGVNFKEKSEKAMADAAVPCGTSSEGGVSESLHTCSDGKKQIQTMELTLATT